MDLADNYEHKHQAFRPTTPSTGLRRMAADIAKSLFRTLAGEGLVFTADHFRSLEVRYVRMAEDTIAPLLCRRHAQRAGVRPPRRRTGRRHVRQEPARRRLHEFLEDPLGLPLIPNWNRVLAAIPEFFDLLQDAVDEDARTSAGAAACEEDRMAEAIASRRRTPGRWSSSSRPTSSSASPATTTRAPSGTWCGPRTPGWPSIFRNSPAVIVNSDGGSTDGTREAVLSAQVEDSPPADALHAAAGRCTGSRFPTTAFPARAARSA